MQRPFSASLRREKVNPSSGHGNESVFITCDHSESDTALLDVDLRDGRGNPKTQRKATKNTDNTHASQPCHAKGAAETDDRPVAGFQFVLKGLGLQPLPEINGVL